MADAKKTETTETKAPDTQESKAETKSETKQPFAMPFLQPQHFTAWSKWMTDQVVRMGTVYEEYAKMEQQRIEQAKLAVDEVARLTKASLDYGVQMSGEFRRVTLDMAKKTADQVNRPAAA